ncbi:hypothetical protein EDC18_11523 [Natranaerovirga pectinivora]|uniref:Small acid-soluble spore protein (Thioredoxin-like protein) n=1 Tax=Natranaerovirga pectinivora TaxID=682400 RepID=A0A4V6NZR0_9FIRM|nr:hypothetical protein [Natranaerovirga pectinivora]TCT11678.1 hypothetical protein EDC18_11523 [Natranaerovirga pectinivora]
MSRKEKVQKENTRRVEQLEHLVEAHTRTERHLEQYSNIAAEDQKQHAKELQRKRENQIHNLEHILVTGQHNNEFDE